MGAGPIFDHEKHESLTERHEIFVGFSWVSWFPK